MLLNQCGAETTIEDSMEATNSDRSSVDFKSNARKRKADFEPGEEEEEEEEESDEEEEGVDDGRGKTEEEPKAIIDCLEAPEWDVDSFDGLEYYSSPEVLFSSEDEPFSEESKEHYRIFKRQMIESKEFTGILSLGPLITTEELNQWAWSGKRLRIKTFAASLKSWSIFVS
ncbi:PREDICTED: glutamic acid-rich protein-like [Camelina sativa]|uniref:Glutamic acid-rich protein-like n=1 Tax=Camelina sativa TaxID=90675 RepID=A0ABM0TTM8_CAMSA|nr:PREDICTED: glutamic acid-rich protein-like [Camelina sativa]